MHSYGEMIQSRGTVDCSASSYNATASAPENENAATLAQIGRCKPATITSTWKIARTRWSSAMIPRNRIATCEADPLIQRSVAMKMKSLSTAAPAPVLM